MAKILFVQKNLSENMAIMQLAAILKHNGHFCEVIFIPDQSQVPFDYINSYAPQIIAFSVMTPEQYWVREIAACIKQADNKALIVAGGPHPTFFPEFIDNDYIDIINIGEGEYSLLELANNIDNNRDIHFIKNLWVKFEGRVYKNSLRPLVDINELPFPDRHIYLKDAGYRNQKYYYFYVSKGCPYHCNFCFIHKFKALYKNDPNCNKMRLKSVDNCIREYKELSQIMKIPFIVFIDSTFNLDKQWTLEFMKRYKTEIGVPFTINVRANLIDADIVKAMAETGLCSYIRMGIEVGNEEYREKFLGKKISNEKILMTVSLLKKYKIKFLTYNMFGLPNETVQNAYETIELNKLIRPDYYIPMVFHAMPGLEITDYAITNGFLSQDDIAGVTGRKNMMFDSLLKQPEIDQVVNLCKLSILNVRFPFLTRFTKFLAKRKPNKLYDYIYFATLLLQYKKVYKMSITETIRFARVYDA